MRRSSAPSQAKSRPVFVSPLQRSQPLVNTNPTPSPDADESCPSILKRIFAGAQVKPDPSAKENQAAETKDSSLSCTDNIVQPLVAKRPRFEPPVGPVRAALASPINTLQASCRTTLTVNEDSSVNSTNGYFSVVWCKRSNKKHKKWEGDAVLVTSGRSVTLFDTDGKEIGKSSGFKSAELSSLKEDETLPIGGKEIQVMTVLTEEQFKSGKCFIGTSSRNPDTAGTVLNTVPLRTGASKPFSMPQQLSAHSGTTTLRTPEPVVVKPRHDPSVPGALVMPRPSASHQWDSNKKGKAVIDVVVDPYLSVHLRPHQREGVIFLYECVMGYRNFAGHGAILADDMGLGKTLQCISLIWTLLKQGPYGGKPVAHKVLIVTPGSLVKNWHAEFKKWLGLERLQVFAVGTDKKIEDFAMSSQYPVLIISYEMFVRVFDTIHKMTFDLIVCDEGHRLKNTNIKTTSLISSLLCKHRVVLTGTPIQNELQEFFSIVEFCNPGVLGSSSAFKRVYDDPIVASRQPGATREQLSLGEQRGAELSRMTQMFVLRRTQEINNKYLPPKQEIVVFCRPTSLQLSLYQQLLRCQLIRSCLAGSLTDSPHLVCIGALKQLCNHPSILYEKSHAAQSAKEESGDYEAERCLYDGLLTLFPASFSNDLDLELHSGKLAVLSHLLHRLHTDHRQEKIVLVSNHTKTLDLIQGMCDQREYRYLRLDGQTPTARRQELVQRFNSRHSNESIFLLSSKAGGVGLNLIGASRLVLYDIDWNPANDLQAMARVWRDGQRNTVYIYRLLTTGSIEEKIYQRQISKQGLSGSVMDVRDKSNVHFSLEDLRDLFSINLTTDCDTHDLLSCSCLTGDQSTQQPVTMVTDQRPCQLGISNKAMQRRHNVAMDELLQWKHLPSSVLVEKQDWFLSEAAHHVSFVFHSEVQAGS